MERKPIGVIVIAVFYILLAILSLLWSMLVFGVGGLTSLFAGLFGAETVAAFGVSSGWTGFLGIIVAVVQLVVAFGLLATKRWAWILALVGVALTVAQGMAGLFTGGPFGLMCGMLGLIVPVIILVYLLLPKTRDVFGV
jgi:hypothetical protein